MVFDPGVVLILIEEKLHTHVISFGEEKCTSGVTSLKTSLILMYWNYIQQLSFHDIHNLYKMADEKVTINHMNDLRICFPRLPSVTWFMPLGSMYKVYDTTINSGSGTYTTRYTFEYQIKCCFVEANVRCMIV